MGTCVGSEGILNSVSTLFSEAVTAEQSEHRCLDLWFEYSQESESRSKRNL